jgi:hypothetical protein
MKNSFFRRLKPVIELPFLPIWLAPVILFSPLLFTGRPMFWGAVFLQFTPWRVIAFDQIFAGYTPLWNPFSGMGAPLVANYQSAIFYPPNWTLLPVYRYGGVDSLALGETWLVVLHLIWAALGMVFLLKQLGCGNFAQTLGALAFSLSGYLVARSSFLSINAAVAWLPWILLCCERMLADRRWSFRNIASGGIVIGMLLLAGHAQTAFYSLILSTCWVIYRGIWSGWERIAKTFFYWIEMVLLGCMLSAIQLLPTAEYLIQSQRASEIGYEYAVNYSFLPWRFLTLLLPNLFGTPANGTYMLRADAYWEDAIYIGVLPLCLAFGAIIFTLVKRDKGEEWTDRTRLIGFLGLSSVLAALIALGKNTPLFPFLYRNIPTFDLFQAPARWMIWLVLASSLIAGFGADAWRAPGKRARSWLNRVMMLGVTIILATMLGGWLIAALPKPFIIAFLTFGVSILIIALLAKHLPGAQKDNDQKQIIWRWLVIVFVSTDLLLANWQLNPAAEKGLYSMATSAARSARSWVGEGRLYIDSEDLSLLQYQEFFNFRDFRMEGKFKYIANALLPDANLYGGLASINNFDPLVPGRFATLMTRLENSDSQTRQKLLIQLGVTLIEQPVTDQQTVRFKPLEGAARIRWVNCAVGVGDGEAALEMLFKQAARAGTQKPVILEDSSITTGDCNDIFNNITIIKELPGELSVQVTSPVEGWLVISDTNFPGWAGWLDGKPVDIHQADYLFKAVKVPAGQHTIRMAYQPKSFWLGLGLSALCLVFLLLFSKIGRDQFK